MANSNSEGKKSTSTADVFRYQVPIFNDNIPDLEKAAKDFGLPVIDYMRMVVTLAVKEHIKKRKV